MLKPVHSESFGRLVPDPWEMDLMTFRPFPWLKEFWPAGHQELLDDLSGVQRKCVSHWSTQQQKLARICRDAEVHAALQSAGIYEVSVEVPERSPQPSESQEAAYRQFLENEEQYCHNVKQALLRYYRFVRVEMDDWFLDDEYPAGHTLSDLTQLLDFDGIRLCRCSSHGVSLMIWSWDPDWDPEHGLALATWQGEVLLMGSELDELQEQPDEAHQDSVWDKSQMTAAELEALDGYIEGFEASDADY